jgi:peptide/nickel transport system permease protein
VSSNVTNKSSNEMGSPLLSSPTRVGGVAAFRSRSLGGQIWQRFRRHRLAMIGAVILVILVLLAVGASWVANQDPNAVDLRAYRMPPSAGHFLGTDSSGRDVFARLLHGARISLSVGVVAVSVYTALGLIFGALAGYYGGWVDSVLMRLADVVMAFPSLVLIITIASVVGPSIYNVMLVIGLLGWPPIARIVRGMFLSLRKREFVVAAQATGVNNLRLIWRHLVPNVLAPVIVAATYGMASAILIEAGLSFLGLGVQPPTASWGNMLNAAQSITILEGMPWLWVPPGLMIALTVLSLNFLGDGLRDALDPHQSI